MELEKKSDVYIFLDTNVFEQCKPFTEINWSDVIAQFKPDIEFRNIILKVPYMVIMELDDHKKLYEKARKALARIRKFERILVRKDLKLKISIRPPQWDRLNSSLREELMENENDHRILAEILIFKNQNQSHDVFFITGDYVPHKLASELGINTINWLDEEYNSFFREVKKHRKPDLELLFINNENTRSVIEWEFKTPEYLTYEDFIESNEDLEWEDPMKFETLRPEYEVESEIEAYNQEVEDFSHYIEFNLILVNNGNHPYSNIDVFLSTQLKENFIIIYKSDVEIPTQPDFFEDLTQPPLFEDLDNNNSSFQMPKDSNVMYHEVIKQDITEKKMDYKWDFGYKIEKIKHNENIILPYPIMIWIPEKSRLKKIIFKIQFTHDEAGKIKEQKLEINLK